VLRTCGLWRSFAARQAICACKSAERDQQFLATPWYGARLPLGTLLHNALPGGEWLGTWNGITINVAATGCAVWCASCGWSKFIRTPTPVARQHMPACVRGGQDAPTTQDLTLPAEDRGDWQAEPGLVRRYHLHPPLGRLLCNRLPGSEWSP